jgi:hypothetical protein
MSLNTKRFLVCCLIFAAVSALSPGVSQAIPAFARKYGFQCTMCHSSYPRLNDFGMRYRANGYQLPGKENQEKTVLESPPPFAMRTSAGYNYDHFQHTEEGEEINQFQLNGLDILSGGLFGRNIGYFLIYPPEIGSSRGVAGQDGTLEMANVIISNLHSTWLNVRAGKFEPAYAVFSVKRSLSASPYEIYDTAFPGGTAFSETQEGVEVTGYGRGLSYAAGYINGSPTNKSDDAPQDVYGRIAYVFGPGEGQTAGQRVGFVAYHGQARPLFGGSRKGFTRVGVDASLNVAQLNVALQYLYGRDDKSLWGMGDDVTFSGFFAEAIWMPVVPLAVFGRFDIVDMPEGINQDITRYTVGTRYYLATNLALHAEYSRRQVDQPGDDATEDFFTARLDFAF